MAPETDAQIPGNDPRWEVVPDPKDVATLPPVGERFVLARAQWDDADGNHDSGWHDIPKY